MRTVGILFLMATLALVAADGSPSGAAAGSDSTKPNLQPNHIRRRLHVLAASGRQRADGDGTGWFVDYHAPTST